MGWWNNVGFQYSNTPIFRGLCVFRLDSSIKFKIALVLQKYLEWHEEHFSAVL